MASQSFLSWLSAQRQKKFVLVLCVLMWAVIFFISGTLFVSRRYETANQVTSELSSSLQEQIDHLSLKVNEEKSYSMLLSRALHEKVNQTLSSLGNKLRALEAEFQEKHRKTSQVLHSLHGQTTSQERTESAPVKRGAVEIQFGASGKCIDSMEQPVDSNVELYSCHGQERNQAWSYRESSRLIENKAIDMCLRAADVSDGSTVKTATCDENDSHQKWVRTRLQFTLEDGSENCKCLDVDHANNKLVIKGCDSSKESQHWTY